MKNLLVIPLFLLLLSGQAGHGQQSPAGSDIRLVVMQFGQAEVDIGYPGFNAMNMLASRFSVSSCDGTTARLCLSPRDMEQFIAAGIPYKLVKPDERKGFFTASSVSEAMHWQSYPTWKHYDTIMHKIADHWPEVCLLDTIGFSLMGRAVLALKISDNPGIDESEPAVMLSSSIHGDEIAGFVMLMRLAEYLAAGSAGDGMASELVSGLEIWINPLANPDGTYRNGDTIVYPVRVNNNGCDLNRNFPDPEADLPCPLQKETLDMIKFLEAKRFALSVNLHSGAEVVNYPWDKWTRLHADDEWFNDISRRYTDTVHLYSEPGYMTFLNNGVTRGWEWYVIAGGRQDFVTWGLGGREVTIEIDETKLTPGSNLETMWEWNHRSLLRYISEALTGVRGTVTDTDTGDPLSAKIFIAGHDADSSHAFSDTLSGAYCRLLPPGSWNLTFSCPGYESYTLAAVLTSGEPLLLRDVQLQKRGTDYPDPPGSGLLIWPNPSDGRVSIMPPGTFTGEVTVTLTNSSGALIRRYRTSANPGLPVVCDFGSLPYGMYIISVRKEPVGPVVRGKAVFKRLITD